MTAILPLTSSLWILFLHYHAVEQM